MDHKDLLDSVIENMNSTKEVDETPTEEPVRDDMIIVNIVPGGHIEIDPNKYDWDTAMANLSSMEENINSMIGMMNGLLGNAPEKDQLIDHIFEQVSGFLETFDITVDAYVKYDPGIMNNKEKLCMVMLYDANNITQTMFKNVSMYASMKLLSGGGLFNKQNDDTEEENIDEDIEHMFNMADGTSQVFRITANKETKEIVTIEPDAAFIDKEKLNKPFKTMDDPSMIVVYIEAKNIFEAHKLAETFLKEMDNNG